MKLHQSAWATIACLLLFFTATLATGQVPQQVNYQGMLADDNGDPVADGDYEMTFAIYDAASGGTQLWSETQDLSVAGGVYNVILGQPGNEIDPADMDGERYLGVRVESDAEMTPRQAITATGFSLRSAVADDADTLDGFEAIDFAASTHIHSATEITSGTLNTGYYSAVSDLSTEGYLGNAAGDIAQNNGSRQVNLNADLLDGLSSSAFVNVAGDSMTGALSVPSLQYAGTTSFVADSNENTFVGLWAGSSNTTGQENTFLGYAAGPLNTEGQSNVFLGSYAGNHNITGDYNTFVGQYAGVTNTEGSRNSFLGEHAGHTNSTGEDNTCVGVAAGYANMEGSGNVFLGYRAGYFEMGSEKLYIDNSTTTDPLIWGDFSTNVAAINGRLGVNTQPGSDYQFHSLDERDTGRAVYGEATGEDGIGVWGRALGDGGIGIYGTGTGSGAYFKDADASGLAYLGTGNRGIWAKGTMAGGTFSHPDNTTHWADVSTATHKIVGTGTVSFVQNHPYDENTVIVYAAPEGDEVAVYTRGAARLVNGEARVILGETFQYVANPDIGLTAHITPRSDNAVIYVASVSTSELVVRSVAGFSEEAAFDYLVYGLRLGFEEAAVLQPKRRDALLPTEEVIEAEYSGRPDLRAFNAMARHRDMKAAVSPGTELDFSHSRELVAALESQRSDALARTAAIQEATPENSEVSADDRPRPSVAEPINSSDTGTNTGDSLSVHALIAELRAEIDALKADMSALKAGK